MKGNHFCLVVSPREFNARSKLAMVCPISGGSAQAARDSGFLVSLMEQGCRTDGQVSFTLKEVRLYENHTHED